MASGLSDILKQKAKEEIKDPDNFIRVAPSVGRAVLRATLKGLMRRVPLGRVTEKELNKVIDQYVGRRKLRIEQGTFKKGVSKRRSN